MDSILQMSQRCIFQCHGAIHIAVSWWHIFYGDTSSSVEEVLLPVSWKCISNVLEIHFPVSWRYIFQSNGDPFFNVLELYLLCHGDTSSSVMGLCIFLSWWPIFCCYGDISSSVMRFIFQWSFIFQCHGDSSFRCCEDIPFQIHHSVSWRYVLQDHEDVSSTAIKICPPCLFLLLPCIVHSLLWWQMDMEQRCFKQLLYLCIWGSAGL